MNLQRLGLKLGILVGIVVFSFIVVTKVQADRPQIHARVVHANGTPLVNADIYVMVLRKGLDAGGSGGTASTMQTDADGYFVETLNVGNKPNFLCSWCCVSAASRQSTPFYFPGGTTGSSSTLDT